MHKTVRNLAKRRFIAPLIGAIFICYTTLPLGVGAICPQAYAQEVSIEVETEVGFICTSLTPLERVTRSHESGATINQGDNLRLEALFKGGEGALTHVWAVSTDGGGTFSSLPTITSIHEIVNAQALPENAPYLYRLHTSDESIQRVETLYTITVIASENPIPPSPNPTPTPDSGATPDSHSRGGSNGVPTSDVLSTPVAFIIGVFLSSLVLIAFSKKESRAAKG